MESELGYTSPWQQNDGLPTRTIAERTCWGAAPQLRATFPKENEGWALCCFGAEVWQQQAGPPALPSLVAFLDSEEPGKPGDGHISVPQSISHHLLGTSLVYFSSCTFLIGNKMLSNC